MNDTYFQNKDAQIDIGKCKVTFATEKSETFYLSTYNILLLYLKENIQLVKTSSLILLINDYKTKNSPRTQTPT